MKRFFLLVIFSFLTYLIIIALKSDLFPFDLPWLTTAWQTVSNWPLSLFIKEFSQDMTLTVSQWVTIILIFLLLVYIIFMIIESILKILFGIQKKPDRNLYHKRKIAGAIRSTLLLKFVFILLQFFILATQAWSIHRFIYWIVQRPENYTDIIKNNFLFLIILVVLLFIKILSGRKSPV